MDYADGDQHVGGASCPTPDIDEASSGKNASAQGQKTRSQRFTLLIRAAKLVSSHGEFVCVIRDLSETGVSVRVFHAPPKGGPIELHMPGGQIQELRQVWHEGSEIGYEFTEHVDIDQFVSETLRFPKRGLRLGLFFPAHAASLTHSCDAIVDNLSQQGACIACDALFAIDQVLRIEGEGREVSFGPVSAKVRWRRDNYYGLVFEETLKLPDFARLAARLQCPGLLHNHEV